MAGTIHSTDYHINGASGDVAHFSTNDKVIHVLDDNKKELGTLRDLYVRGKALSNVAFDSVKVTGVYTVTGIKGVPSSVYTAKPVILQVTAIGKPNTPDMVFYRLIDRKGNITECTVAGSVKSAWGSGGTELKQVLEDIDSSLGSLDKLTTSNQKSLTDSVNEVNNKVNKNTTSITNLTTKFNSHNHDDRYLRLDGKNEFAGNLTMPNYKSLYMQNSKNVSLNVAYADKNDELVLGDTGYQNIKVQTKGKMYINGHQVYTDANAGQGSGIDADKLDGLNSSSFARVDKSNIFTGNIDVNGGQLSVKTNKSIKFNGSDGKTKAGIKATDGGAFYFEQDGNGSSTFHLDGAGNIMSTKSLLFDGALENQIKFSRNGDAGVGWLRRYNEDCMVAYNWKYKAQVMSVGTGENGDRVVINQAPYIQGRRLFLQSGNPGKAAKGSVWIQW